MALRRSLLIGCAIGGLLVLAAGGEPELGYGNTPDALRPFARFVQEPYKTFFVDSLAFHGPGRDKSEPHVETVRIGVLAPLERSHEAYIGQPLLNGIEMAIDEANERGGYHGTPFELVIRNDTGLWGASANEMVRLSYEDSVWAVVGTVDGANTHIAIRVALKTEMPVINVADTDPTLVETKIPWIFRTIPDDRQMAYTLAFYAYEEKAHERVAIVRANNRYGRFGVGEFRAASVRLQRPAPIEINYEVAYERVNRDFAAQVERLQKVKPDAIVLWADALAAGHLIRAIRAAGIDVPVYACDRVLHPLFLESAGGAAEGVIAASPFVPDTEAVSYQAFRSAYRQKVGEEPTIYAGHAYDGTKMLLAAIGRAGLNRYRIRDALAAVQRFPGVTGTITMDRVYSHRGPVSLATVRQGVFVYGDPQPRVRF
ncbi:MAG: ABC transporter substrate-binding protein [Gemmatimonadetes bacterium]|jgi:branched-chain amino acid transport system substrate-binding protein|nr:ABC transporter substrate-binding protein [Gemmatimonadota bacterium]MBT7864107.1 ABC transporter substrate-binding protein [Gemmatimonadota bacterium]